MRQKKGEIAAHTHTQICVCIQLVGVLLCYTKAISPLNKVLKTHSKKTAAIIPSFLPKARATPTSTVERERGRVRAGAQARSLKREWGREGVLRLAPFI